MYVLSVPSHLPDRCSLLDLAPDRTGWLLKRHRASTLGFS